MDTNKDTQPPQESVKQVPQTDSIVPPPTDEPEANHGVTVDSTVEQLPYDLKEPIAWNAPEGVKTQHSTGWYVLFGVVLISLMALAILVFKSWSFAILLPIMAIALVMLTTRPPQTINYAISPKGIYVGDKLYDFSEFRGFGLMTEHGQHSAILLPVKRFSPGLTIYFSETEGEQIVDMLGARLPMQEIKPDSLEKLIHLIKL